METAQLTVSQRKALEAFIRERDIAAAGIEDVLNEAGIDGSRVENLNLATGVVTLKPELDKSE